MAVDLVEALQQKLGGAPLTQLGSLTGGRLWCSERAIGAAHLQLQCLLGCVHDWTAEIFDARQKLPCRPEVGLHPNSTCAYVAEQSCNFRGT